MLTSYYLVATYTACYKNSIKMCTADEIKVIL